MAYKNETWDFSGWATKSNVKCSDGRTISSEAFKHMDGQIVPLVWRHLQHEPSNVLGHGLLEYKPEGVLVHGKFNRNKSGQEAKILVQDGDINSLSIFANKLVEKNKLVHSGEIVEVSLVVVGANPGAKITNVSFSHGDDLVESEDEAIIEFGETLSHEDTTEETTKEADNTDATVEEIFDSLSDEQKAAVYAVITAATDQNQDETSIPDQMSQSNDEGESFMKKNLFENENDEADQTFSFTHEQEMQILADAPRLGSLKASVENALQHAGETYGVENVEYLFPDARSINAEPALVQRDRTWVGQWMSQTNHTPFSRIKTLHSDITADTARALGYVKANVKKEIVLSLLRRITTPTTVYIKAKMDRDDMIDVTTLDVVAWQKRIMRGNLDEEVARAALIGDGRPLEVAAAPNPDKISETNIRPIYSDDELYTHRVVAEADDTVAEIIDQIIAAREFYKGSGNPTMFTTTAFLTKMLLLKDGFQRRMYRTVAELASELRVADIVEVPVMTNVSRVDTDPTPDVTIDLLAILVNPKDYTYGADKGGDVALFEDFDIDYNQMKWLLETRCSGALTLPKSAQVIEQKRAAA